jgi:hypothetical protein
MPRLPASLRGRRRSDGGVVGYPLDRLYEEVAYIAYHFHWPREAILALEHHERQLWAEQIAALNRRINAVEE